jgi:hypothetical protein
MGRMQIVSDNGVLTRVSRSKREEVTGGWRRLHNEELHYLYSTTFYKGDQIIENEMCSVYEKYVKMVVGKPEEKRPHG